MATGDAQETGTRVDVASVCDNSCYLALEELCQIWENYVCDITQVS